ncbi:MAG: hypothetical protein KC933_35150 [Myxococcales bacterium]|nr:hypothetical protein [Myxococcales bacterium]MCB9650130.1 RCC1 repeat-containing protein [Deltaproteobacteria bacterium]
MVRRGIGLGVVLLAGCGFVLSWGAPDDVAWVVLLPLDADGRALEAGKLVTAEELARAPMDIEARVLALGYTAEAVAALGVEVPADATLVPTADSCPLFPAPVWARRTEGDGTAAKDADPSIALALTADWLLPRCAEGYLCVQGQCEARVAEVAVGHDHACARLADGKVACWGENSSMQTGVAEERFVTRAMVVEGVGNTLQLGLGRSHTCVRVVTGRVGCWGGNHYSQLGFPTPEESHRVPGVVWGLERALDLAVGELHACAVVASDDVRCWGSNRFGQLGDGDEIPETVLVPIADLTGVQHLVAGDRHTCALQEGGAVTCWGDATYGQLGPRADPGATRARVLDQDVVALAAGGLHTCALVTGGEVFCWGDGALGELRSGYPALLAPAVAVAAGPQSSCAVLEDGRVQCWGDNQYGQLGIDPHLLASDGPEVTALAAGLTGLALGSRSGCGLDADLRVRCWGWNGEGQLGNGTDESQPTPREVLAAELVSLTAGEEHTCALDRSGRVQCWGRNAWGQIGASYTSVIEGPQTVAGLPEAVEVGAGRDHTCARTDDGRVWCWGHGNSGQLGVGLELSAEPQAVPGLSDVSSLAVGHDHGCVVEGAPGPVRCWGDNYFRQLGVLGADSVDPVAVPDLNDAIRVAAGGSSSCALRADGRVRCWGRDGDRDLGVTEVAEVQLGGSYGCLRKQDGAVLCFGDNYSGQLGDGTRTSHDDPAPVVDLPDAVALSTGNSHACAVRADGSLWCWGSNEWGKLGDGTNGDRLRPTPVEGLGGPVRKVACGDTHTVVFEEPDRVEAWGWNASGQLGWIPAGLSQPAGLVVGLP